MEISAVVLAAGRSRRMGQDKELLEVEGVALWRRQIDLVRSLRPVETFLSCRPEQAISKDPALTDLGVQVSFDDEPDCGPLGGLITALRRCSSTHLLAVAVDLPFLTLRPLEFLLGKSTCHAGAVFCHTPERHEPLVTIFPKSMLPLAEARFAARRLALQLLIVEAVDAGLLFSVPIPAAWLREFTNWNQRSDLDRTLS